MVANTVAIVTFLDNYIMEIQRLAEKMFGNSGPWRGLLLSRMAYKGRSGLTLKCYYKNEC